MIRLIGIPGSHPTLAVELMLQRKRLAYRRFDLPNGFHRGLLRALGFRSRTVPVARIDGRRVVGSLAIARALDAASPEPPLLPADDERRAAVVSAEQWGDAHLQEDVRAITRWAVTRDPPAMATFLDGVRMGLPPAVVRASLPLLRPIVTRFLHVPDADAQRSLAALRGDLDEVDRLLGDGVIGGEEPNAADFQIATSVRALLTVRDLDRVTQGRPAADHAMRLVPEFGNDFPAGLLPAELFRAPERS
jgi:glutathione S-transferase